MNRLIIILIFLHGGISMAQSRKGIELYHYTGCEGVLPSLSARVYYQSGAKWYGEVRCNYEEEKTYAFSVGKTFLKEGGWAYSFTPSTGIAMGKFQGISIGMNGDLSHGPLSMSTSAQYGFNPGRGGHNLFSWSELNWQLSKFFYTGCTMQALSSAGVVSHWEPGFQIGFCFSDWSIPLYVFQPASGERYFALGICREWKK